jgi:hypothetical protein
LAIASIACPFYFPIHWIAEIAIWALSGTFAAVSVVTIARAIYEAQYNKNAAKFGVHSGRLSIPGRPTWPIWIVIVACTPLAIGVGLLPFFCSFSWIGLLFYLFPILFSFGPALASIAWTIYEMHRNRNAHGFNADDAPQTQPN